MTDLRQQAQQYLPPIPEDNTVQWLLARLYELQIDFTLRYVSENTTDALLKNREDLRNTFIAYTQQMRMGDYVGYISPSFALYSLIVYLGEGGLLPKQENK